MIAGDPNPPKKGEQQNGLAICFHVPDDTTTRVVDNMQMMQVMMAQNQASSDRQMQMMMGLMTALMPAMMGINRTPSL